MCEYNPIIRRFQGRGDLRLLRWVQTVPIYNDWTVIKHPSHSLRSSSCIRKEGRGCETSLANVGFSSKKFGSLASEEPAMRKIYTSDSHPDVPVGVSLSGNRT